MIAINQFTVRIPFLAELPQSLLSQFDTSEFLLPSKKIQHIRQQLESDLDCYVMTYNSQTFNRQIPARYHLCANLKGADLTPRKLKLLQDAEKAHRSEGVSFVAYTKPTTLIKPEDSPLRSLT